MDFGLRRTGKVCFCRRVFALFHPGNLSGWGSGGVSSICDDQPDKGKALIPEVLLSRCEFDVDILSLSGFLQRIHIII